ncbi:MULTISPECIES: hypothetical protein [unclassified Sphingomonas]|uniref:hypothetical protein n=1 Tax=unclassified Sphingomonas TaxID=196159 RepID=UPI000BCDD572|nr:MAG: hypothetical protein B7Y98_03070 [Sphingomonas sp. 32-62-10]
MDKFEFFFAFVSLLLGLALTQVAGGLASALKAREQIHIGWLTPLAALLICLDIGSFWPGLWATRTAIEIGNNSVLFALALCLIYYVSASFVFPDRLQDGTSLDDWFMRNRFFSLGGTLIASAAFTATQLALSNKLATPAFGTLAWELRGWIIYLLLMLIAIFIPRRVIARGAMIATVLLYPLNEYLFH